MRQKALIVDDNVPMAHVLVDMLEVFDVDAITVQDGEAALRSILEEPIGLVITDLRMPKMTGVELLRSIKAQSPEIPVVVISGYQLTADDDRTVREIADGFLAKPFKMEDVRALIERVNR
jgi:DNA-binding NtrC family response regulator